MTLRVHCHILPFSDKKTKKKEDNCFSFCIGSWTIRSDPYLIQSAFHRFTRVFCPPIPDPIRSTSLIGCHSEQPVSRQLMPIVSPSDSSSSLLSIHNTVAVRLTITSSLLRP